MTTSLNPNNQSYEEYLQSLSNAGRGNVNYSPFPAETGLYTPVPGVQQPPKPQSSLPGQVGQIAGTANLANQAASWATPEAAATAAPVAGATTAAAPPAAGGIASAAPYAVPALGAVGATLGLYDAGKQWNEGHGQQQDAAVKGINSIVSPASGFIGRTALGSGKAGSLINDGLGLAMGNPLSYAKLAGVNFWSGKDKDQQSRDAVREGAQKAGWLDNNFQVPLSDTSLDLGKDGGFRYTNAGGEERPVYDVDWKDPNANQAVGWIQPLAAVLGKGDPKLTSDFTAQLYNEITKDGKASDIADVRKRIVETYNHLDLKPSIVAEAINAMDFDQATKDAYLAAIENLRPGRDVQVKPGTTPPTKGMGVGGGVMKDPPMREAQNPKGK